jgi:hypothetical protein
MGVFVSTLTGSASLVMKIQGSPEVSDESHKTYAGRRQFYRKGWIGGAAASSFSGGCKRCDARAARVSDRARPWRGLRMRAVRTLLARPVAIHGSFCGSAADCLGSEKIRCIGKVTAGRPDASRSGGSPVTHERRASFSRLLCRPPRPSDLQLCRP